jgi:hypothetical protein
VSSESSRDPFCHGAPCIVRDAFGHPLQENRRTPHCKLFTSHGTQIGYPSMEAAEHIYRNIRCCHQRTHPCEFTHDDEVRGPKLDEVGGVERKSRFVAHEKTERLVAHHWHSMFGAPRPDGSIRTSPSNLQRLVVHDIKNHPVHRTCTPCCIQLGSYVFF